MRTTRQIVFTAPGRWELQTAQVPPLQEQEVLVKVAACGLCTWERDILAGKEKMDFPFTGGHEIAATIIEKGPAVGSDLKIGDKVAVAKWKRCNQCYECRRGFDNQCRAAFLPAPPGQPFGPGGFSEYLVAQSYEVFPVPGNGPLHYAALAEPVACVLRSIRRVHLEAGDTAVIMGAGLMGLLFLKILKLKGQKVVVVQRSAKRRELAGQMGADLVIDPAAENWVHVVQEFTAGRGAQSVFYTAGGADVLNQCLQAAAIGGYVLIYAPLHSDLDSLKADEIHYRELVVLGSIRHDKESFRQAASLLGEGLIRVDDLCLEFCSFADFGRAIERANTDRDIHRILLTW